MKKQASNGLFKPLGDRVLVEPRAPAVDAIKGGIFIPDSAKEKPVEGLVIALGRKDIGFDVKVGDMVLLPKHGGVAIKIEGKEFQLIREEDLLGVIS